MPNVRYVRHAFVLPPITRSMSLGRAEHIFNGARALYRQGEMTKGELYGYALAFHDRVCHEASDARWMFFMLESDLVS